MTSLTSRHPPAPQIAKKYLSRTTAQTGGLLSGECDSEPEAHGHTDTQGAGRAEGYTRLKPGQSLLLNKMIPRLFLHVLIPFYNHQKGN